MSGNHRQIHTPPEVSGGQGTDDCLPAALSRALEARRLYAADHPEAAAAVGACERVGCLAESAGTWSLGVDGFRPVGEGASGPAVASGLAGRLRACSVVGMRVRRACTPEEVRGLLEVLALADAPGVDTAALVERAQRATNGAVVLHQPNERLVGSRSSPADGVDGPGASGDEAGGASGGPEGSDPLDRFVGFGVGFGDGLEGLPPDLAEVVRGLVAMSRGGDGPGEGDGGRPVEGGGASARGIDWFRGAVERLGEDRRRQLVGVLASREDVPFEAAALALSELPLVDMAAAMGVLARRDSALSQTSLMLLKRLSDLAAGSPADVGRLGEIAARWLRKPVDGAGADGDGDGEDGGGALVGLATDMLDRRSDGEFRSEDYSAMLDDLLERGEAQAVPLAARLADERGLMAHAAADVLCDVAAEPAVEGEDRGAILRYLGARAGSLAADGRVDTLARICDIATGMLRAASPTDRRAAVELLARAREERWLARALGSCPSASLVREHLEHERARGGDAADLLASIAAHTRTPAGRRSVVSAASCLPGSAVADGCIAHAAGDGGRAVACAFLVGAVAPDSLLELLGPALGDDRGAVRLAGYRALATSGVGWPVELCVRGLCDGIEAVRMLAARAAARSEPRLLADRLCGSIGRHAVTANEARVLGALIARGEDVGALANRLAWGVLASSLRVGAGRRLAAVLDVLERAPSTPLVWLALRVGRMRVGWRGRRPQRRRGAA